MQNRCQDAQDAEDANLTSLASGSYFDAPDVALIFADDIVLDCGNTAGVELSRIGNSQAPRGNGVGLFWLGAHGCHGV